MIDMGFYFLGSWACLTNAVTHNHGHIGWGYLALGTTCLLLAIFTIVFYVIRHREEKKSDKIHDLWGINLSDEMRKEVKL
jgi:hypothetical protein